VKHASRPTPTPSAVGATVPGSLVFFLFAILGSLAGCEPGALDRTCSPPDPWSCHQDGFFCGQTPRGGRCVPWSCGDGVQTAPEECDGPDAVSCASWVGGAGSFSCGRDCRWDFSGCARCGNGLLNGIEACDGERFADGISCESLGYSGGRLECLPTCRASTRLCLP
jgi:hypothetical protein